jgi:hypothetical protein
MKKTIILSVLTFILVLFFWGCSKEAIQEPELKLKSTTLLNYYVKLDIKVFLEGPTTINPVNGLTKMTTNLKTLNLIPLKQPYNIFPWFYQGNEKVLKFPINTVDWVLVDIVDITNPSNKGSIKGFPKALLVRNDGELTLTNGAMPTIPDIRVNAGLKITVSHRNHLKISSLTFPRYNKLNNTYYFTFLTDKNSGNNLKLVGGKWVVPVGDINQDGLINTFDYDIWAADFGKTKIYINSDLDLDGNVFVSDYNKWAVNY